MGQVTSWYQTTRKPHWLTITKVLPSPLLAQVTLQASCAPLSVISGCLPSQLKFSSRVIVAVQAPAGKPPPTHTHTPSQRLPATANRRLGSGFPAGWGRCCPHGRNRVELDAVDYCPASTPCVPPILHHPSVCSEEMLGGMSKGQFSEFH